MEAYYAQTPLPNNYQPSIFLAGPTPRSPEVPSWRPQALELLQRYPCNVLVPEFPAPPPNAKFDYPAQVEWEHAALKAAQVICFWIPRSEQLPGYTTNIEFGAFALSGNPNRTNKVVLGYPPNTPHTDYLAFWCKPLGIPLHHTLAETLHAGLKKAGIKP